MKRLLILGVIVLIAAPVAAQGKIVTCESKNNFNSECPAGGSPVTLVRQLSHAPCQEGVTWGVNPSNGKIWVADGCRAQFRVGHDAQGDQNTHGGYLGAESNNRAYYEDGYRAGRRDARNNQSMAYQRHAGDYDSRFEQYFARGYREGWSDQHANVDMKASPKADDSPCRPPSGLEPNAKAYFRDGCHAGRQDGRAHMSMAYQRHTGVYDSRFESAYRQGYETGWRQTRNQ